MRILTDGRRRFRDRVALPQHLARRRVQRGEAASETAARIPGAGAYNFLEGRYRHKQDGADKQRAAGDHRRGMIVEMRLPQQFSGQRIDSIRVGAQVAEIDRPATRIDANGDGRAHWGACFKCPINASAARVDGIDLACGAPKKDVATDDRWLRECTPHAWEPESPFEFKLGHLRERQPGHIGWLKAALRWIDAPAIPMRQGHSIG